MTDEQLVTFERDPRGFAWVGLNRPQAANAVNVAVLQELHRAFADCARDPSIAAVVLHGAGRHFSAGGDIKEFGARSGDLPELMVEITSWLNACVLSMVRLPKPVIAAVHGAVAGGGGFGVMCAADLVVSTESARFVGPGTGLGMSPDAGTTLTLVQHVGFRPAMQMILMNTAMTAAEAHAAGLVNWIVPDEELRERAGGIAAGLAAGPHRAIGESKRLMWSGLEDRLRAQLSIESHVISDLSGGDEAREGISAAIDRRPPVFHPETNQATS